MSSGQGIAGMRRARVVLSVAATTAVLAIMADPAAGVTIGNVAERYVFYNNSSFDFNNPAATPEDDLAIATDKTALLPGNTAAFTNYTCFSSGITGVMADLAGVPDPSLITIEGLDFDVANDLYSWAPAPDPSDFQVRAGAGVGGSVRVTVVWPDNSIQNQWLRMTVIADPITGLIDDDVSYFGNAIGESGDSSTHTFVNATDMIGARNNFSGFGEVEGIGSNYDYNRDRRVDQTDVMVARNNTTYFLTDLKLITVPFESAPEPPASPIIVVGDHVLLPDTPGQTITLAVTGADPVAGLNLLVQVGDGGPEVGGTDGPEITAMDLVPAGGIFDGATYLPQADPPGYPQAAASYLALSNPGDYVPAEGILAVLTIDTTGFPAGTWDLLLSGILAGQQGPYETDFAGVPVNITNGTITIVPEPASIALLAAVGLGLMARRRKPQGK